MTPVGHCNTVDQSIAEEPFARITFPIGEREYSLFDEFLLI
jgi:hypothetical protein